MHGKTIFVAHKLNIKSIAKLLLMVDNDSMNNNIARNVLWLIIETGDELKKLIVKLEQDTKVSEEETERFAACPETLRKILVEKLIM